MGDHLWTILNHLEKLTKQYQRRIAYEQESGIRQEDANMFILDHLNIPVSDVVGAPLLQSDVNLEAIRGQCVLISGPSGCGKTSLFRICAGFQSIDAKQMILPARRHLLFIPQRPYLPHGSLRFQALFLVKDQNLENTSGWKLIVNIFKFIHLPFQSNDTKLIVETIIAWLLSLIMAGVNTWAFYTFIDRTAALYNGLTSYASGTISLTEAKQSIISDIASYIVIVVVVPTAYSLSAGGGRVLASLYTRRQLNYLSRLLLDDFGEEHPNNLLYYSRHMSEIPNSLSHEIAELNTEIFNLLFGQVYYVGIIILFKKWRTRDESQFVQFLNAHKRIDLQAEQIALSGESVCMAEENELRQKLDSSVHSQIRNGLQDPTTAQTFITLSVYMLNLYLSVSYITYFSDPLTRIQAIGIRVVNNLEQLQGINMYYRRLANEEQERRQRVYIESKRNEPSLVFEHVDVRIPNSSHVLISNINLTLHSSDNLIVTGSSGCGKSTLLRLLAGLVHNETDNKNSILHIIPRQNIIILCQQLHLIRGTLREQLSYLRLAHGLGSVTDDNYAQQLLNEFSLGHLIDRYSMNGKRQVWSELLSIGEQQRLMIVSALLIGTETARLLILDETTSGCDKQTEETIYKHLQRSNLQFISISHRKEISKYHSRQMTIDATDTPIPTPVFKTRF
ncbi:unnamed protein product [Adineta steineri]|uniref:AAA+ ATPase domain-containing protein n=2 Tax=Adineta steineri TaxID=433720 RepID=A0A819G4K5_9BILA|nr:unnamed protein product [Adineta steineri]